MTRKPDLSPRWLILIMAVVVLGLWAQCEDASRCRDRGGVLVKGVAEYACVDMARVPVSP